MTPQGWQMFLAGINVATFFWHLSGKRPVWAAIAAATAAWCFFNAVHP